MRCLPALLVLLSLALSSSTAYAHEVDPFDTLAVLRHAFEDNDCTLTKDQILKAFQAVGYDLTQASEATTQAIRRDDVERLIEAPETYSYTGSPKCAF